MTGNDIALWFQQQFSMLGFLLEAFVLFWIGWKVWSAYFKSQSVTRSQDQIQQYEDGDKLVSEPADYDPNFEIEVKSNTAVAWRWAGIYLGLAIPLYGLISGPGSGNYVQDLLSVLGWGVLLVFVMLLAAMINDKFIVTGVNNTEAVRDGNNAVGTVECFSFVATGIIALAAFSGSGAGNLVGDLLATLGIFALGQVVLLVLVKIYEFFTTYEAVEEIRRGNDAAGLMLGSWIVALSIVLSAALSADIADWTVFSIVLGLTVALALVVIRAIGFVFDWIFLPNTDFKTEIVRDRNIAPIMVASGVRIGAVLFIVASLI